MDQKRWIVAPKPPQSEVLTLCQQLNISPATASLLINRGITNFEKAKSFFRPSISALHDPFLMKDMEIAVDRVCSAIQNHEKILIYGDYDVDGTTSVAMTYLFIRENFPDTPLLFYIPDRYKEGYGVSKDGILYAKENNCTLLITLDCGIKAHENLSIAKDLGIDVIICDHHLPDTILPQALAILDPKRQDCHYPYKELSGCGVGFKLIQGISSKLNIAQESCYGYLDFVTVSICADIVSISGENRILAYYGLKILNKEKARPGFEALKSVAGIKNEITVHNIVFGFAPRINAAGRIKHAKTSVELLIAQSEGEAQEIANKINENNSTRKDFDSNTTLEALALLENDTFTKSAWSTVLFKKDWNKGVVGIVASRCIEKYHRPTIILTENDGKAVGSARSIPGFDLYKGISECADLLEQFGGHTHAAGLSLKIENIDVFKQRFDMVVRKHISKDQLIPSINIDYEILFDEINLNFFKILNQFAPFGPDNMQPVFSAKNVTLSAPIKIMKEVHVKIKLAQKNQDQIWDCIGFNMIDSIKKIDTTKPFDICFQIIENTFNTQAKIEFFLKDLKQNP